jgi:peptidyl-prolyl cis-trans isomerase B (cyclophilin B)
MSDQSSEPVRFFAKSTKTTPTILTMSNKRTRQRQLAKHAARRHATRRHYRRRRGVAIGAAVLVIIAAGTLAFFTFGSKKSPTASPTPTGSPGANCDYKLDKAKSTGSKKAVPLPKFNIDVNKTYTAVMKTSLGTFDIQLDPKSAPCTVNSVVYLSKRGFYNGLTFHRIDTSLGVIQGGDPAGNGTGGPGYNMPEEAYPSDKYTVGTVAMAKSTGIHSTGSQFFVVTGKGAASLPPDYTIIGKVSGGMAAVMKIFSQPVVGGSGLDAQQPKKKIVIKKVTIKEQ